MHTDGCLFYLTAHLLPTLIHLHLTPKEYIKDSFGLTLTSSYYLRWPVKNAKIQPKIGVLKTKFWGFPIILGKESVYI